MSKITDKDLTDRKFVIDSDRNIFHITPDIMYRLDYFIDNDACPIFVTKVKGEYCHIVPSNNSLRCAFVPIVSTLHLDCLIAALSGNETDLIKLFKEK